MKLIEIIKSNILYYLLNIFWYIGKFILYLYSIFIKYFSSNNNNIINNIYFIKNNNIIVNINKNKLKNIPKYDYALYRYNIENYILLYILENINNLNKINNFEICNYQFIYVTIKVEDKTIDITNILNDRNNYLYTTNTIIFNNIFMIWLIKHKLNLIDYINYNIVILDNNMNEITINNKQYIKLNKNDYNIINI